MYRNNNHNKTKTFSFVTGKTITLKYCHTRYYQICMTNVSTDMAMNICCATVYTAINSRYNTNKT